MSTCDRCRQFIEEGDGVAVAVDDVEEEWHTLCVSVARSNGEDVAEI